MVLIITGHKSFYHLKMTWQKKTGNEHHRCSPPPLFLHWNLSPALTLVYAVNVSLLAIDSQTHAYVCLHINSECLPQLFPSSPLHPFSMSRWILELKNTPRIPELATTGALLHCVHQKHPPDTRHTSISNSIVATVVVAFVNTHTYTHTRVRVYNKYTHTDARTCTSFKRSPPW